MIAESVVLIFMAIKARSIPYELCVRCQIDECRNVILPLSSTAGRFRTSDRNADGNKE